MRGITGWLAVMVVLLLHGGGAGVAADPWQLDGWKARAVVTIAKPLPDASVDSASVRVVHQGRAKPDGSDFRLRDAAGKTVPFQLTWHELKIALSSALIKKKMLDLLIIGVRLLKCGKH